ncbi:FbpB family small basic protein [Halobacillus sp. K22]
MMRTSRISFEELVAQNKQQLLKDQKAIDKIEELIDEKHVKKLEDSYVN